MGGLPSICVMQNLLLMVGASWRQVVSHIRFFNRELKGLHIHNLASKRIINSILEKI